MIFQKVTAEWKLTGKKMEDPENINIKMDDDALKQVPKFKYLSIVFTEGGKNEETKVMFINKKQPLCLNNLS